MPLKGAWLPLLGPRFPLRGHRFPLRALSSLFGALLGCLLSGNRLNAVQHLCFIPSTAMEPPLRQGVRLGGLISPYLSYIHTQSCRSSQLPRSKPPRNQARIEHKPNLLSPDIFRWGGDLPRGGAGGAKKFGMPLETRENKLFWRDIPGFCRDISGATESSRKKKVCVQFSSPKEDQPRDCGAVLSKTPFETSAKEKRDPLPRLSSQPKWATS